MLPLLEKQRSEEYIITSGLHLVRKEPQAHSMARVFFSYAHEDKAIVEHFYSRLIERYSDVQPWLDKYEIVGGESLTEKIADGINNADKFVVFISPASIVKPWVNRELKKAIIREISSNTTFIIPVLLGEIPRVPDFLEDKLYLDIRHMTESEFLQALYWAIKGMRQTSENVDAGQLQNLRYETGKQGNLIEVRYKVQYWAEDVAFQIEMKRPYKNAICGFIRSGPSMVGAYLEEKEELIYRICLPDKKITPDNFFYVHFYFDFPAEEVEIVSNTKWEDGMKRPPEWRIIAFPTPQSPNE